MMSKRSLKVIFLLLLLLIMVSILSIIGIDNMKEISCNKKIPLIEKLEIDTDYEKNLDQCANIDQDVTCTESDRRDEDNISTMSRAAILILLGTSVAALLGALSIKCNLRNSE